MTDAHAQIEAVLAEHLETELGDRAIARDLAAALVEDALSWRAPTVPLEKVRTIIGFTFGNRMLANGNREPGPVNAALADLASACTRRRARACGCNGKSPRFLEHLPGGGDRGNLPARPAGALPSAARTDSQHRISPFISREG